MHTQQSQLVIRIDEKLKKQAQESADELGLSLSVLVKVLLKNVINTKKVVLGDNNFDFSLLRTCEDKNISSKLEKLADKVSQKYSI